LLRLVVCYMIVEVVIVEVVIVEVGGMSHDC
jgi:hypothetical protein